MGLDNTWRLIHTDLDALARVGLSVAPVVLLVLGIVSAKLIRRWVLLHRYWQ